MKLLLISGHGAGDPGATSYIGGMSYREADETRRVTKALAGVMDGYCDVTIYPTDRNAFEDHKKGTLPAVAHFSQYDFVLEIHFNALKAETADGKTKGVECFVTTEEPSTTVEQLICTNVAKLGLTNRGVKRHNWSVIRQAGHAGVSAALLEVCFIDDPDDMAVYLKRFPQIMQGIADALITSFGLQEEDTMTYDTFKEYMSKFMEELAAQQPSDWSKDARAWAEKQGVILGNANGQMKYRSFVTREELAQMLYRAETK